jgi:hypothetical protein
MLVPTTLSGGYGFSQAIHCNYIKSLQLNTSEPNLQEIIINFSNISDFRFLSSDITSGTGYTVNKIFGLIQLIANSGYTSLTNIKPVASAWKILDMSAQIYDYISGNTLTSTQLIQQPFKIPLKNYNSYTTYWLKNFISSYPSKQPTADLELCFGDETFFMGNVTTDIKATAYVTDIPILLDLNEFNSSTNSTWDSSVDKVVITEIGIYDANKNLVAIGKLNNPIQKDSSIARTIVFDVDF